MADNNKQKDKYMGEMKMEIKTEPSPLYYTEDEMNKNGFAGFDNSNMIPSTADIGTMNLWTSKATNCLITQYKKYRSMVGQSTQIKSLREMFEMISLAMQHYGYYFSPQKCENKWRVLERKYKNLVFREGLKKPGRMRHYGHWEHKRALDEIFNKKKKHLYLKETDFPPVLDSTELTLILPRSTDEQDETDGNPQPGTKDPSFVEEPNLPPSKKNDDESSEQKGTLTTLFERFLDEMEKNFALAERNKERRHKEKMTIRQSQLEVQKKLLKLEEQKIELQKSQMIAAAQHVHLNM